METDSLLGISSRHRSSFNEYDLAPENLNFYSYLAQAQDITDFTSRLRDVIGRMGFTDYHFAQLEGVDELAGMVTTLPSNFMETYKSEALYEEDIFLRQAKTSTLPFYQSDLEKIFHTFPGSIPSQQAVEVRRLSQTHGVYESYNVSVPSSAGAGNAALSIFIKRASPPAFRKAIVGKENTIQLLADALNVLGPLKYPHYFGSMDQIDDGKDYLRWRQVLELMVKEDINQEQVADRLNLRIRTIQDHLKRAKKDLGTKTLASAIAKAIKLGLIDFKKTQ